jgi:hypothetical protein
MSVTDELLTNNDTHAAELAKGDLPPPPARMDDPGDVGELPSFQYF